MATGAGNLEVASFKIELGLALDQAKLYPEAETVLAEAKQTYDAIYGASPGILMPTWSLGLHYFYEQRFGEAERYLHQAIALQSQLDLASTDVTSSAGSGFSFIYLNGIYNPYLSSAWQAAKGAAPSSGELRSRAFAAAQALVASAAGAAMSEAAARESAKGELGRIVREQQDLVRLLKENDDAVLAAFTAGHFDQAQTLRVRRSELVSRITGAGQKIDREFPAYRALLSPRPMQIAEVQRALRPDEGVLLLYSDGKDVYSFAVSAKAATWNKASGSGETVDRLAKHLRCQVDIAHCPSDSYAGEIAYPGEAHSPQFDLAAAYRLYALLLAPVEPALTGVKRLYVTASGTLGDLPLGILVTAQPSDDLPIGGPDWSADPAALRDAKWLADRYAITFLPSVSGLRLRALSQARSERDIPFAGYGDPKLGPPLEDEARGAGAKPFVAVRGVSLADPSRLMQFRSLPGTKRELTAIGEALGASAEAIHLEDAATESAVRSSADLADARVIVFATHGFLPGSLEGLNEPGLIFTPPSAPSERDDGVLTASEAAGLKLRAEWLILSACNTASSEGASGADSLSSLARGFLYAGARTLLASRWSIDDDATAALTVNTVLLHRQRPELGHAGALQLAMRAVRTGRRPDGSPLPNYDPSWVHPAAWAPFASIANFDN